MNLWRSLAGAAVAAGMIGEVGAQPRVPKSSEPRQLAPERGRSRASDDVPPAYRPPPGMCRIWLDNVAPAQQPAPTDCNSAVRNRPANARVLFGDDYAKRGSGGDAARLSAPAPGGVIVASATLASATMTTAMRGGRWAPRLGLVGDRPHGPMADDAAGEAAAEWAPADSTARPAAQPPVTRATARRRAVERADELLATPAADDWEAGYAAGYRDAMRGRRPRVRGADRAADTDDLRAGVPGGAVGRAGDDVDPLVVVPSGADVDPRYFNNGRYPPPGRANGVCLDRDADGWCDDPRFGAPVCRDLDGDGRCDDYAALAAAPLPATLPEMRAGADVRRGLGSATALRWLGTSEVTARVTDTGRGGAPSRVVWLDANTGALLQVWTDRDADGVADRVEIYRNGRRVKLVGR